MSGWLAARLGRTPGVPEDSRVIRLVVALMVEVSLVAVVAQGATDAVTGLAALVLAPVGYAVSYLRRRQPSVLLKVSLAAALILALGSFLRAVDGAQSFDDARRPLASLFLWVQVLHAFDVPRRRDLGFSVVSSLMLMAEAGALSFGTGFLVFLLPWLGVAGTYLFVTLGPRPDETPAVLEVRRPAPMRRRASRLGRTLAAWLAIGAVAVSTAFVALPRLPGLNVALPPFRVDEATAVPDFRGQVVNPGLAIGSDGVPEFSDLAYPGFSSSVDLRSRGRLSDEIVLRVRSPQAALWRGLAYDTYDGTTWTASDDAVVPIGRFEDSFQTATGTNAVIPTRRVLATFYVQTDMPNVVFGAYRPDQVFFPTSQLMLDAYGSLRSPILLEDGVVYSVISEIPAPTPALLRTTDSLPVDPGFEDAVRGYLELPAELPPRVVRLAHRITAGAGTRYDAVAAVESWLHQNTTYNLDVPPDPPGVDAVDHFLFERREGFCEHIASAMAVLLRAAGIPTRLVTGFGPGTRNPFTGYWEVRASDAHAWVEVLYPGAGWVSYDPTFGVPPASLGLPGRFIAPEVLRSVGRFLSAAIPEPLRHAAAALGRSIASIASAWPLLVVAAALGLGVVVLVRRRGRRRSGPPPTGAVKAFEELETAMAARGHPRREGQTPAEFLRSLHPSLLGERGDAELIVRLFERDRFSGAPLAASETASALAAAHRIAAARSAAGTRTAAASGPRR